LIKTIEKINMESDSKFLLALSQIEGLGPASLQKLLQLFTGDFEACFKASFFDLQKLNLPAKLIEQIIQGRQKLDPDKIISQLKKENISFITFDDINYPRLLKETYGYPLILYYRGDAELLADLNQKENLPTLAVVGSRKITAYGQMALNELLPEVCRDNALIISGLAYGVDSLAHRLALENNGQTIAIVGSGLAWDYLYPSGNKKLAENIIAKKGLIISEFPPYTRALKFNFPRRNRLISGLAKATLIVEASIKSGALITAKFALEQNREVLAIPGPITSLTSAGTNYLIQNGARLITTANDLRQSLGMIDNQEKKSNSFSMEQLDENELIIIKILSKVPLAIDKIIETSTLDTAQVNALLLQLELKNLVKNLGGQNYISLI
jgi:DNA processing protein